MACTIGGNIAENSGGPHTLKYGVTTNHVLALELVLPDGEVVELGGPSEERCGYDLVGAVVGAEGTTGIVTRATLKLMREPENHRTLLATFPDADTATHAVSMIIASGIVPAALEMMDQLIIQAVEEAFHVGLPLDAGAVLIIELEGLEAGLTNYADEVTKIVNAAGASSIRLARDEAERALLWKARKRAFGAVGRLAPNYATQDGVVPRTCLPRILRVIADVSRRYDLRIGNVFHAGDGNLHPIILYDEREPDQVRRAIDAGREILKACIEMGGSLTGEHGIGVEKIGEMELMFSPDDLRVMTELRHVFDPLERSNPGKVIPQPGACVEVATPRRQVPICRRKSWLPLHLQILPSRLESIVGAARVRAPNPNEARAAETIVEPSSVEEICELVRMCEADHISLAPVGASRSLSMIRRAPVSTRYLDGAARANCCPRTT